MSSTQVVTGESGDNSVANLDDMLADLGINEEGVDIMSANEIIVDDDGPAAGVVAGETAVIVTAAEVETPAEAAPEPVKAKGKGKAAKPAKKAEAEKPAEATVEAAPKAPKVRISFKNKAERLQHNLGNNFDVAMVLEKADQALEGEALQNKQAETLAAIMGSGVKVQTRITFVLEFVMGKSAKLNEVMKMALSALKKDGFISSAADGTFMKAMFAKYTMNTAKAMGNNTLLALKALKVIKVGDDKGKMVANAESVVLGKLGELGAY